MESILRDLRLSVRQLQRRPGLSLLPLKAGRGFNRFDREETEPVTIVSERLAKMLWPGQFPLSFAGALSILLTMTAAACAVPAWRASRIDPAIALREE
jgi:hypothetical protein